MTPSLPPLRGLVDLLTARLLKRDTFTGLVVQEEGDKTRAVLDDGEQRTILQTSRTFDLDLGDRVLATGEYLTDSERTDRRMYPHTVTVIESVAERTE